MLEQKVVPLDFGDAGRAGEALSETMRGMRGSRILLIAGQIREAKAAGREIADLTVGDFDASHFPIPDGLRDRIVAAVRGGQTNYPPSNGLPELRAAVANYAARTWGVSYPMDGVLVSAGARPTIFATYRAVVDPGDEVVYPVPSWNNNHYAYLSGAKAVAVPTTPDRHFMPTMDDLRPHLSTARLICLNTPSNPTGTVMDPAMVVEVAHAIVTENRRRERDGLRPLYLLLDAVYASLTYGGARFVHPVREVPDAAPWVFTVDGISKAYAATGLRVGWVLAPPAIVAKMNALLGHVGAWAPRPEQCATAAFLEAAEEVAEFGVAMRTRALDRLKALHEGFEAMRAEGLPVRCIEPQGAIYLSLQLDWVGRTFEGGRIPDNEAIRRILLDHADTGVVPFQAFGLAGETGWFRISVGAVSMDDVRELMPRMRSLMMRLA